MLLLGLPKAVVLNGVSHALLALLKLDFPAVSKPETAMEELVAFFAWDLEADKAFTRNNPLVTFSAVKDCFSFHGHLPFLAWYSLKVSSVLIVSRSLSALCKRLWAWSMAFKTTRS